MTRSTAIVRGLDDAIRRGITAWAISEWRRDPRAARSDAIARFYGCYASAGELKVRREGIIVTRDGATTVYGWPAVARRIAAFPEDAVARLQDLCRQDVEHTRSFVPFGATPAAQGCGPAVDVGPQTAARARYEAESDVWWSEHGEPYYARAAVLRDAIAAAYDACFESADLVLFEVAS